MAATTNNKSTIMLNCDIKSLTIEIDFQIHVFVLSYRLEPGDIWHLRYWKGLSALTEMHF